MMGLHKRYWNCDASLKTGRLVWCVITECCGHNTALFLIQFGGISSKMNVLRHSVTNIVHELPSFELCRNV